MSALERALALASKGYRVFPVRLGDGRPQPLMSDWGQEATTDSNYIQEMWDWDQATHPAVACKASKIVVVDLDVKNGKDGVTEWDTLCDGANAPSLATKSGGRHLYFRADPNHPVKCSVGKLAPGIDIRAEGGTNGGFVVVHEDPSQLPSVSKLPQVPAWLPKATQKPRNDHSSGPTLAELASLPSDHPNRGNDWLVRLAGHYANSLPDFETYLATVRATDRGSDDPQPQHVVDGIAQRIWDTEQGKRQRNREMLDVAKRTHSEQLASSDGEFEERVGRELVALRAREAARERLRAEQLLKTWTPPPSTFSLAEELQQPDAELAYAIDRLLPLGGNALLAAQQKAGKTTLTANLLRALADGTPFLNEFGVRRLDGRVAFLNYELDAGQFRRWLREVNVANPDRVAVLNLRGHRLPLIAEHIEDWLVEWLRTREVEAMIMDPFARAFSGCGSENSNDEVGAFLETVDVVKRRAGVSDLVLTTHTGRMVHEEGQERARGATRLDDWADSMWVMVKDNLGDRYFRANGRDVELPESKLEYDPSNRSLSFVGGSRREERTNHLVNAVHLLVRTEPGIGSREIREKLKPSRAEDVTKATREAIEQGLIKVRRDGPKHRHYSVDK